ncbi:MAG: intradiol ring-cleavage dioxygenase [Candidatus Limnocylindrales bacterium]
MSGFHIDDDDRPIGRMLSRREVLVLFGGAGAALATGAITAGALAQSASPAVSPAMSALPACVVVPDLTEGPYFVDERLDRSDIRADSTTGIISAGARLDLSWVVTRIDGTACVPFAGAMVDVWHCDAAGAYSDVQDRGSSTEGQDFLRGYQLTDADGRATFTTIYPGWYDGRAVHIHFKIRTDPDQSSGTELTSQLFFDEAFTDTVYAVEPYAARGQRTVLNDQDGIFQQSGGQTLVTVSPTTDGYAGTFAVGIRMS